VRGVRFSRIDGVLLLDKASGMSSNAALQEARRLFSAMKAGHTGTLDPLATGLLPLCFGEATKFSMCLLDAGKVYEAELLFGIRTDTGDSEGDVVVRREVRFSRLELETALGIFRGEIRQTPPMFSALKRGGQPLYRLARLGVEVAREPRAVTIHALELLDFSGVRCRLRVACSKGTYIRVLAEDIGEALGCGAHLAALRRTAVGGFGLDAAITLNELKTLTEEERGQKLFPVDALLKNLPILSVDKKDEDRLLHGNPVSPGAFGVESSGQYRIYADGRFIGIGEIGADGSLKPRRLIATG
jgi:tRNA pseudouridine55 synthase